MSNQQKFQARFSQFMNQGFLAEANLNNNRGEQVRMSTQQMENLEEGLLRKFQTTRMVKRAQKLKTQLKKYLGRHYPIPFKQEYGFSEYWQNKKNNHYKQDQLQYYQYPNHYYFIVAIAILIINMCLIWCLSIHKLFDVADSIEVGIMAVGFIVVVADAMMQYQYLSYYGVFGHFQAIRHLKVFWRHLLLAVYFLTIPLHFSTDINELIIMDFAIIILLKLRSDQIRQCVKLQIASTTYKNAFNMIQLFSTLLPVAHFFALTLYFVTLFNEQNNWLKANDLDQLPPIEKYIYSLYFTFTTMLTVGYGDLSPVNITQILMIICVQIIGIVTYGYILNEIGHILSDMRQQGQILSKDISTIAKMANYYDLDKGLVEKAKNFLVCRKKESNYLTPEQQQHTLSKLQDDLREEICRQNSLRILKSSLFYVCNWTKNFHIKIAKKVYKKIFSPNQQITQIPGKQRIYIFKKGKVQIHANRPSASGYKKYFKKILKTIEPNQSMQVSDNIYGYSFIISNTPIKLTALNKQFVVAYYVEGKDFMQAVMDGHLDREYFYEMKTNIDSISCPESWEAPSIINSKEHYHPSIQYLIKKVRGQDRREKNVRTTHVDMRRFRPRTKRVFYYKSQDIEEVVDSSNNIQISPRDLAQSKAGKS